MRVEQRSTLQQLCVAVLCGDDGAKFALYDHLKEEYESGRLDHALLLPVTKIDVPLDRLRVAVFVGNSRHRLGEAEADEPFEVDVEEIRMDVVNWMLGFVMQGGAVVHSPLVLQGIDRIEVYQLPEGK